MSLAHVQENNEVPKKKVLSEKQRAHLERINSARPRSDMIAMNKKAIISIKLKKEKRLQIEKEAEQKLLRGVDKALNALIISAEGTHRVVVKSFDEEGKIHIETVRDQKRIDALLANGIYGDDYLILAGAEPDWRAAEAFLNRALGKTPESLKVDVKHTFSLTGLAKERKLLPKHEPLPVPVKIIDHRP